MKRIYKKIIFIISAIALFSVIAGVVKYSLTYIENNPEKKKASQRETFLKLIYIKCFLVSTEINQFLLHTLLISHLNLENGIPIGPLC